MYIQPTDEEIKSLIYVINGIKDDIRNLEECHERQKERLSEAKMKKKRDFWQTAINENREAFNRLNMHLGHLTFMVKRSGYSGEL